MQRVLQEICLQISIVCGLICISTKILDWYNPYMNFSGHVWVAPVVFWFAAVCWVVLKIERNWRRWRHRQQKSQSRMHGMSVRW